MWNRRRFVLTLAIGLVSITCLVVGFAQHLSHEDDSRSAGITILLPEATNVHVNMHLQKFSDLAKRLAKSFSGRPHQPTHTLSASPSAGTIGVRGVLLKPIANSAQTNLFLGRRHR